MKGFLRTSLANFLLLPNVVKVVNQLRIQQEHSTRVLSNRCEELEHLVLTLEGRINSIQVHMPNRRSADRSTNKPSRIHARGDYS